MSFWKEEHRVFKKAFSVRVSNHEARKIIRKFIRRFKVRQEPAVVFYKRRKSYSDGETGRANGSIMHLNNDPSVGLIIHELGHVLQYQRHPIYKGEFGKRNRNPWHDVYFWGVMNQLDQFAKKKNYWEKINE